jgi:hypothetical protein
LPVGLPSSLFFWPSCIPGVCDHGANQRVDWQRDKTSAGWTTT